MQTATAAHPAPETLHAFALGCLETNAAVVVEDHMSNCADCSRQVERTEADGFVRQVKSALEGANRDAGAETFSLAAASSAVVPAIQLKLTPPTLPDGVPAELADHPRYRVLRRLGGGGMGDVFLAEHTRMERQVALKVLNPRLINQGFALARFLQEVKAAARLEHPNIVRAYDADEAGKLHFLVMEYVEGTDLATYLRAKGSLPWDEAARLVRQAALGLQHAHEAGMVHRDIKPHNLMLTRADQVKVLDFGLARFAREAAREEAAPAVEDDGPVREGLTLPGAIMGTADYMAPEQAHSARDADVRADIYSLGCTLYHLVTGQVPFPHGSLKDKVDAHLHRPPQGVKSLRPDVPDGLAKVVATMLAKEPKDRYQTPLEVIAALGPFTGFSKPTVEKKSPAPMPKSAEATTVSLPAVERTAPTREKASPKWVIGLAASLLLVLLAATVVRIRTNYGEMIVSAESPDVKIEVLQEGKRIDVIDTKTDKKVQLGPGDYELRLSDSGEGLRLLPEKFTIKRNDTVLATVEYVKSSKPKLAGALPAGAGKGIVEINRFVGHEGVIVGAALSADGRYAVTGGGDCTVRVWDLSEGKLDQVLRGHTGQVYWAELSPDGKQVVSGGDDNDCRLWDLATGNQIRTFSGTWVTSVRFSPNGRHVAASGFDGEIPLWETKTGKEVRRLKGHQTIVEHLAFSPDGRWIASCSGHWDAAEPKDFSVRLWEVNSGNEIRRFEGHTDLVSSVAFSADGSRILSSSYDGTLRLWEAETGRALKTISGIADLNFDAALDPTGRRALSTGSSGMLRYWDLESGKELATVPANSQSSSNPVFFPDGKHALSTGGDGILRVWALP